MDKMVYTVSDIAEILSIGMNKAYDLIHKGGIPYIRLGRKIRIPKKAFDNWLNSSYTTMEENRLCVDQ